MEIAEAEGEVSSISSSSSSPSSFVDRPSAVGSPVKGPSHPQGAGRFYEDDDEEGDVCRICRNPGDDENPLRYPCACSGSIKFVHQECLLQWLSHSNARNCEVCKHAFSFSPVYADNAPARLPLQEFVVGMAMKACHVLQFFARLAFVISIWLFIIPFVTFWIWRLTFVRSFGEAQMLFLSHLSSPLMLTDCLHGFLLSASIVFIFLGATSLRDYFGNLRDFGGHDNDREDEGNERNGIHALRRPQVNVGDGNGDDVGGIQGIAEAGQIIRRNAENVARLEAHVEQMFDGLDDADGAEDVPFDELVGMQGPVFHLIENATTVLASNAVFLGVVIFIPFSVGRLVLFYISLFLFSSPGPVSSSMSPFTESALSLANITLENALISVKNSSESQNGNLLGLIETVVNALKNDTQTGGMGNVTNRVRTMDLLKGPRLSDATTLAIGYMFLVFVVSAYVILVASIRYVRGEPLTARRFFVVSVILEAVPSLFRQFLAGMKHLMTMLKVSFLLVIELGVFPLMCGCWLDICTIRMLGTSVAQRIEFFSFFPLASALIHWFIGIFYMLQISIFVSLLRGVLRNGVLYFLRDPADPNYNPFRDLIDDPVHKHARRVLLSVVVYGSLIVMLIFLPVKLAMRLAPAIFPLDISFTDPITEILADMLMFQICVPFAMEHFKPRATIKFLLQQWLTVVGWVLDLTEYLLPGPEDANAQENANGEPRRRVDMHDPLLAGGGLQDHGPMPIAVGRNFVRRAHIIGNVDVAEDSDTDDQADSERYGFILRIVLLLILAWMTLLISNSALIVAPIFLGRALFNSLPRLLITHGIKCNDLYAFNIGCYVIWGTTAGIWYAVDYIRSRQAGILISQIWKWFTIVLKSSVLLSIWILVIPVLIGFLFELVIIVPIRVPVDQSPIFLLYQDWALGLIFLKIWTKLVMLDQMALLVDESWRLKFERVLQDGFSGLQGLWVLREIVIPILTKLLTALCVPYVFAKGIFPVFGYPLIVNSAVYRFAWLGCLLISCVYFCAKRFHVWITHLHNSIRDDRYLIGRQLHNYGEGVAKTLSEDQPANIIDATSIRQGQEVDAGLRLRHPHAQAI